MAFVDFFFFVFIVGQTKYSIPPGSAVSAYWRKVAVRGKDDKTEWFFKSYGETIEGEPPEPFRALVAFGAFSPENCMTMTVKRHGKLERPEERVSQYSI